MIDAKWMVILILVKIVSPLLAFVVGWIIPSPLQKKKVE